MANNKVGLSYYSIDTDRYQDRKIKRLKKVMGCKGLATYDYLLCEVYRDRGCVLVWDEDTAFDVAEYLGLTEKVVQEIVGYCGSVGLFDAELLSRGIITSRSIQQRYLEACARSKRKDATIPEEWRLVPIREESPKTTEESEIITEESQKTTEVCDKEKKSKVKENKIKESVCEKRAPARTHEEEIFDKFLKWAEALAPLSLRFAEPLQLDGFVWLYSKYGGKRMKQCAADMHSKEAYKRNRNALNTWKKWIERV